MPDEIKDQNQPLSKKQDSDKSGDTLPSDEKPKVDANTKITALQFADINGFSNLDKRVVKKMHGNNTATMLEWHEALKDNFKYKS